jgi:hypothetical protein
MNGDYINVVKAPPRRQMRHRTPSGAYDTHPQLFNHFSSFRAAIPSHTLLKNKRTTASALATGEQAKPLSCELGRLLHEL